MNCGQGAFVTRVHSVQHVERLRPSHLTDDDPVRTHTQSRYRLPGFLSGQHHAAAAGDDRLAGHKARLVAEQKSRHGGKFFRPADAADRRVAALQESIDAVTVTEVYDGVALRIYATSWLATNDRLIVGVAGEQRPHRTADIWGSTTRWVELITRDDEWIGGAAFDGDGWDYQRVFEETDLEGQVLGFPVGNIQRFPNMS